MTTPDPAGALTVRRLSRSLPLAEQLADDVRRGFARTPRILPPKYLYDERGSRLFEAITELPEYYLTRTETAILEANVDGIIERSRPTEIVELGSGSSRKTRLLLEAMHRAGTGDRYVPLDISESAVAEAATRLIDDYPWLRVQGNVGDFTADLPRLPRTGRRIIAFLGSTIGNLLPPGRAALLRSVADSMQDGDAFLLGADLVKPPEVLVPAYDDAAGVTADFNRNMLLVLNRLLDGDLPVDEFDHRAVWNAAEERIEMHLVAQREIHAELRAIGLTVRFRSGEPLVTEHSCKFRVEGLERELLDAGLEPVRILEDDRGWFTVIVARRMGTSRR